MSEFSDRPRTGTSFVHIENIRHFTQVLATGTELAKRRTIREAVLDHHERCQKPGDRHPASPQKIKLEKHYGELACKGLLGAAQLSRRKYDEPLSKGFASQTGRKQKA